jgi:uncharacterized integral membrane protein
MTPSATAVATVGRRKEAAVTQENLGAQGTPSATRRAGIGGGAVATLVGAGLLGVFMLQNTQDVTLQFLVWSFTWPLWLFTVVTAALGAVVWIGAGIIRRHRRRVARRAARDD